MSLILKLDTLTKSGDEWAVYVKVVEDTTGKVVATVHGTYAGSLEVFREEMSRKLRPIIREIRAAEAGRMSIQAEIDKIDLTGM